MPESEPLSVPAPEPLFRVVRIEDDGSRHTIKGSLIASDAEIVMRQLRLSIPDRRYVVEPDGDSHLTPPHPSAK